MWTLRQKNFLNVILMFLYFSLWYLHLSWSLCQISYNYHEADSHSKSYGTSINHLHNYPDCHRETLRPMVFLYCSMWALVGPIVGLVCVTKTLHGRFVTRKLRADGNFSNWLLQIFYCDCVILNCGAGPIQSPRYVRQLNNTTTTQSQSHHINIGNWQLVSIFPTSYSIKLKKVSYKALVHKSYLLLLCWYAGIAS